MNQAVFFSNREKIRYENAWDAFVHTLTASFADIKGYYRQVTSEMILLYDSEVTLACTMHT